MPIKQGRNLRFLKLWSRKRDIVANRIRFNDFQKKSVCAKCNGKCAICGKPVKFKKMTIDHITPLPGGGTKENIEMVQDIHSAKILDLIYWFVKRGYREEKNSVDTF